MFDDILKFEKENINELLVPKINNISAYPIIRTSIYMELIRRILKQKKPHSTPFDEKFWFIKLVKSLVNSFWKNENNSYKHKKFEYVAVSTFRFRGRKINNLEKDIIYDSILGDISKNSLIIEQQFRFTHSKKPYSKNIYYDLPIQFVSELNALLDLFTKQKDKQSINKLHLLMNKRILNYLPISVGFPDINKSHIFRQYNYGIKVAKIIRNSKPKLTFIHLASYGGAYAIVTKLLKESQIPIAEYQHGFISKEHPAYNYGFKKNLEYQKYLPDYFLTLGQYWTDQLSRYPNKVITIGNPEMAYQYNLFLEQKDRIHKDSNSKNILIVSQGTVTNIMVNLATKLSRSLKSSKIVYKLHPGEVPFVDRYKSLYKYDNIKVMKTGNIYDYIRDADYIVGFNSTTLFEAVPFEKPIFILKHNLTDDLPDDLGNRFVNAEELSSMILKSDYKISKNWKYYWDLNWKKNLHKFVDKYVK